MEKGNNGSARILVAVTTRHSQVGVLEGRVGFTLVTNRLSQVGVLEGRVGLHWLLTDTARWGFWRVELG